MPSRGYLLCCIERTGSSLLGQALSATGVAGKPLEYFNPVVQDKPWMRDILGDDSLSEGLSKILIAGTTPNGVFGVKIHCNHFRYLGMSLDGERGEQPGKLLQAQLPNCLSEEAIYGLLESRFSDLRFQVRALEALRSSLPDLRIIWLRRRNMVARAISHLRARQSGVWFRSISQRVEDPANDPHEFDLARIRSLYCLGHFEEGLWQQFFHEQNISPLSLAYEDLVANYESTVRLALSFLDLEDPDRAVPPPRSAKQSDSQSKEWEELYKKLTATPDR